MGLLLLVNAIDRTNVGFAALTMNEDLGFSPTVFGFGAGVFFIGYALFQVPANVLLEHIGARRWVCRHCLTSSSISGQQPPRRAPALELAAERQATLA